MNEHDDAAQRQALWDEFLQRWPLESLAKMSLDDYTRAGDTDCFTYWVETKARPLGSIQGNTALKFSIYAQSAKAVGQRESRRGVIFADGYGWRDFWGKTKKEAFSRVRQAIVDLARAARSGQLELVESSQLSPMYKWKLAFLYQDRQLIRLLPIYSTDMLRVLADDELGETSQLELNRLLLEQRGDEPLFVFAKRLWTHYEQDHSPIADPVAETLIPAMAIRTAAPVPVALNRILYGPPGTGKTYAAIDEALDIIDPDFLRQHAGQRTQLKQKFDELTQAGRVRFVTFHQSFSYEDFVEGLRAERDEQSGLKYQVSHGVFKDLCVRAGSDGQAPQPGSDQVKDLTGRQIWKMSLGATDGNEDHIYEECVTQSKLLLGYGQSLDYDGCSTRTQILDRLVSNGFSAAENDFTATAVHRFKNEMQTGDLVVVTDGNLMFRAIGEVSADYRHEAREENDAYCQSRPVRWLRQFDPSLGYGELMHKRFSQMTIYRLGSEAIDRVKLEAFLSVQTSAASSGPQPYVLIIDEINRGNVSRIFGELLTLIEPSKRAGAPEALSVTLPYSRLSFSVPANVHILGTMNTADRSLAGLDIALRRRFTFKEMPPRPDLLDGVVVDGIDLGKLLAVMNERIEVLLDRDHALGHAYFMPLAEPGGNTLPALAQVFRQQVLPLLQEYFFEDWERISWVLNDPAKVLQHQFVCRSGRSIDQLFGSKVASELTDRRWRINEAAFGAIESYQGILPASA